MLAQRHQQQERQHNGEQQIVEEEQGAAALLWGCNSKQGEERAGQRCEQRKGSGCPAWHLIPMLTTWCSPKAGFHPGQPRLTGRHQAVLWERAAHPSHRDVRQGVVRRQRAPLHHRVLQDLRRMAADGEGGRQAGGLRSACQGATGMARERCMAGWAGVLACESSAVKGNGVWRLRGAPTPGSGRSLQR